MGGGNGPTIRLGGEGVGQVPIKKKKKTLIFRWLTSPESEESIRRRVSQLVTRPSSEEKIEIED